MALDMHDIGQAIYDTSQQIQRGVKSLYGYAKAYAEAEQEYRLALAREIMRLRDEKMPVTLVNDVARGNLANIKYKRDLAELTYQACRDSLKAQQSQVSALQTILNYQTEVDGEAS